MVEMEKRTYRLTGFTPMLGSSPADPYVRTNYIASKAPDPVATAEEEREYLLEREENKITVFLRNPKNGALMLLDYQVKGYIKGSLEALRRRRASRPRAARRTSTCSYPLGILTSDARTEA